MQRDFSTLSQQTFDLAIIGGGATGAAIALDASLRGLRVALIDKGDFSAATSAGSSKLMHGGLRYLANGDVRQVREGLRERRHWSRMAKHLVQPLPFVIPIYERNTPSSLMVKLGLHLYDALSFDRNAHIDPMQKISRHRPITAAQVRGLIPDIPQNGTHGALKGGLMYQDGQMLSPERLCLAMLRTAMQADAVVVNYATATDFITQDNRVTGVRVKDGLSRRTATVSAQVVINAAGPWADALMAQVQSTPPHKKLVRSKGIHLVTRALTHGASLAMPIAGEHLFVLPWMGHSILATTDTKFDDAPDNVRITQDDITLLLDKTNAALPDARLTQRDIIYAYVGLRPLVADIDDKAGASYGLSRGSEIYDHAAHGGPEGMLSALGGKWTTSRRLGEQIVTCAFDKLDKPRVASRSADAILACTPRDDLSCFMEKMRTSHRDIEPAQIDLLSRLYGRLLPDMLASSTAGLSQLKDKILAARVAFAVHEEMAVHLSDVVLRRLIEGQLGTLSAAQTDIIADYMAAQLNWSKAELARQKAALHENLFTPA